MLWSDGIMMTDSGEASRRGDSNPELPSDA